MTEQRADTRQRLAELEATCNALARDEDNDSTQATAWLERAELARYVADLLTAPPLAREEQPAEKLRLFPIQGGPAIPWAVIVTHEAQARRNHGGQSLDVLAERGGLSACEAVAVLSDRPWRRMDAAAALNELAKLAALPASAPQTAIRALESIVALDIPKLANGHDDFALGVSSFLKAHKIAREALAAPAISLGQAWVSTVTASVEPDVSVIGADVNRAVPQPPVVTFCVQCGPDVNVDEDGICVACGCDALPSPDVLAKLRARLGLAAPAPTRTEPDGHQHCARCGHLESVHAVNAATGDECWCYAAGCGCRDFVELLSPPVSAPPPAPKTCATCGHDWSEHAYAGLGDCYAKIEGSRGICQCRAFAPADPLSTGETRP